MPFSFVSNLQLVNRHPVTITLLSSSFIVVFNVMIIQSDDFQDDSDANVNDDAGKRVKLERTCSEVSLLSWSEVPGLNGLLCI